MHWTLVLISIAVAASVVSGVAQWRLTGNARVIGILVSGAWICQQTYYFITGESLEIWQFIVFDALIIGYLLRSLKHWTDNAILFLYIAAITSYFVIFDNMDLWWFLYSVTLAQIILSSPWVLFQKAKCFADHGPLRREGAWNGSPP